MNVQRNNFQGIYGKMAMSQTRQGKSVEALSKKMTSVSEKDPALVKKRNALSSQNAFESMRNASAKFMTNNLKVQAKQPIHVVENKRYLIEESDEIEGCWHIYDKELDKSFVFDPSSATVQVDQNTRKYYIVADALTGERMDVIPAGAALLGTLSQFLNVESADSILTSSLNDKYTMTEGYIVGKDIENFSKWEEYFEEKRLAFEKVVTDDELAAIAKEYDAGRLAAKEYAEYKSENYRIVPDNEAKCFDIYNLQGERLGAFDYADIKIRKDSETGKQFLISEHGSMSYDAIVLDNELKEDLQNILGVDALETEDLQGFTLKKHSSTGIRYLVRDNEEGRGGKVLLESEADQKKYEALAQTYLSQYPNLIDSMEEAYIWADLEIKGLAQHTKDGIISMGFDGMSYNDNANSKNNWSVLFSEGTYQAVFEWLQNNKDSIQDIHKFAAWQDVFEHIGSRYERIWSKDEEKQGYLNN